MPCIFGCARGDRDGDISDLEKVPRELVHCIMDADETLDYTAPLDVNRIDHSTHKSEWPIRADAVGNRESVEHRADVLGMKLGRASYQIYTAAVFWQSCRPERKALRDAGIPGVIATRARRARGVKSYEA